MEAYNDYLQGLDRVLSRPTKARNEQARELFQKAIALDPKYANPYAALGWVNIHDLVNQWTQDPQAGIALSNWSNKRSVLIHRCRVRTAR